MHVQTRWIFWHIKGVWKLLWIIARWQHFALCFEILYIKRNLNEILKIFNFSSLMLNMHILNSEFVWIKFANWLPLYILINHDIENIWFTIQNISAERNVYGTV